MPAKRKSEDLLEARSARALLGSGANWLCKKTDVTAHVCNIRFLFWREWEKNGRKEAASNMKSRKNILRGALCLALAAALLLTAIVWLVRAERSRPADSLGDRGRPLQAAQMLPGGSDDGQATDETEEAPQPSEPQEETDAPEETAEASEPQQEPSEPDASSQETEPLPSPSDTPDTPAEPQPGPVDPDTDPDPTTPRIVTDLKSGAWTKYDLTDDTLCFYAYAAGAGSLSLRVYWKEAASPANNGTRLIPEAGRNFRLPMTLNTDYQVTMYLYRDGKQYGEAAVFYLSYRASLADDDRPDVGDYPPVIVTNRDGISEPVQKKEFTLVVTARTNENAPGGSQSIYAGHLRVWLDDEELHDPTGSAHAGYEYVLHFYPPQVGDERVYTVRILAWDDLGNSRLRTLQIVYRTVSDGDVIGTATVRIDATTLGLGILDEGSYEIRQGETAAQTVLQFLEDCGYERVDYDGTAKKNGGFYLLRIYRADLLYRAKIDERLWTLIQNDGISLTGSPQRDSLGEHDYTWGAGWMYDVDGYYPGKGLSEWSLDDGDVLTLRFTLAWGKDIDGFGATGGQYGDLTQYCYVWRDEQRRLIGHDFAQTARVEPTQMQDGYVEYTCTRCGEVERETLPKTEPEPTEPTEPDPTEPPEPTEPEPTEPPPTDSGASGRSAAPDAPHAAARGRTEGEPPHEKAEKNSGDFACFGALVRWLRLENRRTVA